MAMIKLPIADCVVVVAEDGAAVIAGTFGHKDLQPPSEYGIADPLLEMNRIIKEHLRG